MISSTVTADFVHLFIVILILQETLGIDLGFDFKTLLRNAGIKNCFMQPKLYSDALNFTLAKFKNKQLIYFFSNMLIGNFYVSNKSKYLIKVKNLKSKAGHVVFQCIETVSLVIGAGQCMFECLLVYIWLLKRSRMPSRVYRVLYMFMQHKQEYHFLVYE